MKQRMITATARIPEELLEEWRVWIVLHGGNVVVPREKKEDRDEQFSKND